MRSDKPFLYVLNGEDPVATDDVLAWCNWFEKTDRSVNRTEVGDACVLTTFMDLDQCRQSWPQSWRTNDRRWLRVIETVAI